MADSEITGKRKNTAFFYGLSFCSSVILISSILIQTYNKPPINDYLSKSVSPAKPYGNFQEFYPFYLTEHTQLITRQLHYTGTCLSIIYFLTKPILLIPMLAGGLAAYSIIPFSRHLSTGLVEAILFLIVYMIGGKLVAKSFLKTLIPLLLGYGFSWIGHFNFEHNKPAAFIYPTYSFYGDIHMLYDSIKEYVSSFSFMIQ